MKKNQKVKKEKAESSVEVVGDKLTLRQELFCRYFTQNKALFGNATHSYAEAYNYKLDELSRDDAVYEYVGGEDGKEGKAATQGFRKLLKPSSYDRAINVCAVEAARLLRNPKIQKRKIELMNEILTDQVVDSELAYVIQQDRELSVKLGGIREYNSVKGRIIKKMEHTGANGEPLFENEHKDKAFKAINEFVGGDIEQGG